MIIDYTLTKAKFGSRYTRRPFFYFNRHVETIVPSLFFRVPEISCDRERLELDDGDFLDLDWYCAGNRQLMILSHGMEGSTDRYYIKRAALYFFERGWDVLAWNNRGCSGEFNRQPVLYHHGSGEDIEAVVNRALEDRYESIALLGFSMGGNHTAKYLCSEYPLDRRIVGGVGFSVTCDMRSMDEELEKWYNLIYKSRFLGQMKQRVRRLAMLHPEKINLDGLEQIGTFEEFNIKYTVPLSGLEDLDAFYYQSSPNRFFMRLQRPFLVVNALNDPLLGEACYPYDIAARNRMLSLETPRQGGHVGFNYFNKPYSYMEKRTEEFIAEVMTR